MNTEQQKIMNRIKKCLKLAVSADGNESKMASHQALKMVEKFALDGKQSSCITAPDFDQEIMEIIERLVRARVWLADQNNEKAALSLRTANTLIGFLEKRISGGENENID